MQQLWTTGTQWDDHIPIDLVNQWTRYQSKLQIIETISIPRLIVIHDALSIQLHAFSDIYEKGYAAAIYLRTQTFHRLDAALLLNRKLLP